MLPILSVEHLHVDYLTDSGAYHAVKDVSFTIGKGEIFGLAGESGCGKSTIAHAITRLAKPPAWVPQGKITFDGRDLLRLPEPAMEQVRWQRIAMVFQSAMNSLNPLLRIEDQFFDVYRRHTGASRAASRVRATQMLELVGISPTRLGDYPFQFSGGMRQRIVIAIALMLKPDLLIMDEPTTALDVVVQHEIMAQIYDLQRELGFSILFITHDLHLMAQVCDRIGIMLRGELVELGQADQIAHDPKHAYTRKLWNALPVLNHANPEVSHAE